MDRNLLSLVIASDKLLVVISVIGLVALAAVWFFNL